MPLILAQAHVTSDPTELVTVEPGFEVLFVSAGATTIGTSDEVTATDGFTLPDSCPVPFAVPADDEPVTFWGVSAMFSAVSWTVRKIA